MNSLIIDHKKEWEQALSFYPNPSFLQSWTWGEFQKELGFAPLRFACFENNSIVSLAQVYPVKTKFFHFLYCPRGPYAKTPAAYLEMLNHLSSFLKKTDYQFLLIEPTGSPRPSTSLGTRDDTVLTFPKSYQLHPFFIQPGHTAFVSLDKSIDELYRAFRKTTRAAIKKAKENKIQIASYQDSQYFHVFADLYKKLLIYKKYKAHSLEYIKKQFKFFTHGENARLYLAYQNKTPLASTIILFYNQTATYLHAAASLDGKKLGASQALLWQAVQDAKGLKQTIFDLWGVAPLEDKNHPLSQISVFKRGFSDCEITYPMARVCIKNHLFYKFYFAVKFLKNAKVYRSFQRRLSKILTIV